jgi:hypothetical protein
VTDQAPQLPDQAIGGDPRAALEDAAGSPAAPQEEPVAGTPAAAPQEEDAQGAEPLGAQETAGAPEDASKAAPAAALRVGALVAFSKPRPGVSPAPTHFGIVVASSATSADVADLGLATSFDPSTLWPL